MTRWIPTTTLILLSVSAAGFVAREANSEPPTATQGASAPLEAGSPSGEENPAAGADEAAPAPTPPQVSPVSSPATLQRPISFDFFADGSPVPALPGTAPLKVKLGVALFRYQGAQGAAGVTRTRAEALALAQKAAALPEFKDTLSSGDPGSSTDVGWIGRGVLERAVEYVVFSLAKGEVTTEPVDTPRGFWVVQRIR